MTSVRPAQAPKATAYFSPDGNTPVTPSTHMVRPVPVPIATESSTWAWRYLITALWVRATYSRPSACEPVGKCSTRKRPMRLASSSM